MPPKSLADYFVTFIVGLMGTFFLGLVGLGIYAMVHNPFAILCMIVFIIVTFAVGWCIEHLDEFLILVKLRTPVKSQVLIVSRYGIPVLDGLQQFETKYEISTIKFMSFVSAGVIPPSMDNLDYLEWLSLVNELSMLNLGKGE